jgi:hypothetical protein
LNPNAFTSLSRGISQFRKFGWRLLWHRYVTRRRILGADTIRCSVNAGIEVHMQVCARDWLNALWTVHSFWHCTHQPFQLLIFCDASVTEEMQARLRDSLPGANIISSAQLPATVKNQFAERFPMLYRLRCDPRFFTLPKVIDSYSLRSHDVVLTIDPDVLFFARPDELLADLDPARPYFGRFNLPRLDADPRGAFCIDASPLRETFGVDLPLRFNCGLGSLNYGAANWEWVEHILRALPPDPERAFMLDQTIFWLLAERGGWAPLPLERYVLEPIETLDGVVARHYFGKTRDLFYAEGIAELLRHNRHSGAGCVFRH